MPFIDGEEDKLETEPLKILGIFDRDSNQFIHKDIKVQELHLMI